MRKAVIPAALAVAVLLASPLAAQHGDSAPAVDRRSYNLGIIGAFSEVVKLGVKKLALSEVMTPEEMDGIIDDAAVVAARNGVEIWRETDFLVTDLYPADVALGKHVLLIYTGNTLEEYLALKADKEKLVAAGDYEGVARERIAWRFGRLLSYPEPVIDDLIKKRTAANREQ